MSQDALPRGKGRSQYKYITLVREDTGLPITTAERRWLVVSQPSGESNLSVRYIFRIRSLQLQKWASRLIISHFKPVIVFNCSILQQIHKDVFLLPPSVYYDPLFIFVGYVKHKYWLYIEITSSYFYENYLIYLKIVIKGKFIIDIHIFYNICIYFTCLYLSWIMARVTHCWEIKMDQSHERCNSQIYMHAICNKLTVLSYCCYILNVFSMFIYKLANTNSFN